MLALTDSWIPVKVAINSFFKSGKTANNCKLKIVDEQFREEYKCQ